MKLDSYEQQLINWVHELIGYLVRLGASISDAEDIAQESILALLRYEEDLPSDKLKPWLFRVGINRYFDLYRLTKRRREIILQNYQPFVEEFSTVEWQEESLLQEALQISFSQLSLLEQTMLYLKYEEELSIEAIGFILKRPTMSVKTEFYRIRKKLRRQIEEWQRKEHSNG